MVRRDPTYRPRIHPLRLRVHTLALVAVAVLSLVWPSTGSAENTVSLEITGATPLSVGIRDGVLSPVRYSHQGQRLLGMLHLLVSDGRGTSAGWSVSIIASDFFYVGTSPLGRT